jgi:hypothetical protein
MRCSVAILIFIAVIAFSGCNPEPDAELSLVGFWELDKSELGNGAQMDDSGFVLHLKNDFTYSSEFGEVNSEGTWVADEETLTLKDQTAYVETVYTIVSLAQEDLVLEHRPTSVKAGAISIRLYLSRRS